MTQQSRERVRVSQRIAPAPARWLCAIGGLAIALALLLSLEQAAFVANEPATPNVVVPTGSPVPCGKPVTSWGSGTADDVRVQIQRVDHDVPAGGTPTPAPVGDRLVVELEIANLGDATVWVEREDVTVRTCGGRALHPAVGTMDAAMLLGPFAPGTSRTGSLAFVVPDDDQARLLVVAIQETDRSGARVECELVVARNNGDQAGPIAEGCSAFGGTGQAGADAIGGDATAAAGAGD